MKGVLLAGGKARRLGEMTEVTNKHLLGVYDRPMIFHPLRTLVESGVEDILVVSSRDHVGAILRLLGSGERFKCRLTYRVQEESGGIAQALSLAKDFVGNDSCAVILGDNVFENTFRDVFEAFEQRVTGPSGKPGAQIFLKESLDAKRFGVAELDGQRVISIEEKPTHPKSPYAVTGLYLYDSSVFDIIHCLHPSGRGEYEITDVNNAYIRLGSLHATVLEGNWTDAGTFESLFRANVIARKIALQKASEERLLNAEEIELLSNLIKL